MTIWRVLFLLLMAALAGACTNQTTDSCPCKVRLLHMDANGAYSFQDTYLSTLTDISSISSPLIQVSVNPGESSYGRKPVAQYMFTRDHVLVPKTTETSELLSLYKNMEDLYKFDVMVGTNKYLTYPETIGLQTNAQTTSTTNNSFYIPDFDTIVVLKFAGNSKPVPISVNPGLIAHEHFHAIFEHITHLYKKTKMQTDKQASTNVSLLDQAHMVPGHLNPLGGYNYLLLSSLNEGLADFWAYIFTGLGDTFKMTLLDNMVGDRAIYEKVQPMPSQIVMNNILNYGEFIKESSLAVGDPHPVHQSLYIYAAYFSHFLKTVSDKLFHIQSPTSDADKKLLAQWIVNSLNKLKATLDAKSANDVFLPQDFVASFIPADFDSKSHPEVCAAIQTFLLNYDTTTICK